MFANFILSYQLSRTFSLDFETGREETKVRLWWHEHWQARNSSKEAEEEVNVPMRTFRVQQVRAKINLIITIRVFTSIEGIKQQLQPCRPPIPMMFLETSRTFTVSVLSHPHAGDDGGGYWVRKGFERERLGIGFALLESEWTQQGFMDCSFH